MPVSSPTEAEHPPIFTVGLTGGIGCGKSTVANGFAARGVTLIDTDEIAHQLTGPDGAAMPAICAEFGRAMQQANGAMDRVAMRHLVFTDAAARGRLEAILHPLIRAESLARQRNATGVYAMLVVPLLIESGAWQSRCDRILVIDCPPEIQLQRVMARSGLSESETRRIMAAQASREERLAAATEVLDNAGDLPELDARIERLHTQYLLESTSRSPILDDMIRQNLPT